MKKSILVIVGGRSSEHDVSVKSVCNVIEYFSWNNKRGRMETGKKYCGYKKRFLGKFRDLCVSAS